MISNLVAFLNNLTAHFRPVRATPPAGAQPPPPSAGGGLGPTAQGPQQRQTHTFQVQPLANGSVVTRLQEIGRRDGTLSVDITESRVPTANGTVVDAREIVLICGECGLPSEERWYCDFCSMPLCVPHLLCVRLPGTGDVLHLCRRCATAFYREWNTWNGQLSAPFSIRKETRQGGRS